MGPTNCSAIGGNAQLALLGFHRRGATSPPPPLGRTTLSGLPQAGWSSGQTGPERPRVTLTALPRYLWALADAAV